MSTISQAVTKKSNRLRVDMRWRRGTGCAAKVSTAPVEFRVSGVRGWLIISVSCISFRLRGWHAFCRSSLVFSCGAAIAELQENIQEEDAGECEKNQGHEQAVDAQK